MVWKIFLKTCPEMIINSKKSRKLCQMWSLCADMSPVFWENQTEQLMFFIAGWCCRRPRGFPSPPQDDRHAVQNSFGIVTKRFYCLDCDLGGSASNLSEITFESIHLRWVGMILFRRRGSQPTQMKKWPVYDRFSMTGTWPV